MPRAPDGAPERPLWEQLERRRCRPPRGRGTRAERLQKVLATRGYGSRRVCEDLIAAGRVTVNGEVAMLGRRVDPDVDLVEVDGAPVGTKPGLVHYLLNKPPGVVTTAQDTHGRPTVVELVPADPRVFPVGRLDADTEGLLLLTNDGELANRITHPRHGLEKEYLATVGGGAVSPGACVACVTGSSSMMAPPPPRRSRSRAPACCGSRSTRAATARSAACARPSATP